jgi:hypothetical protein
MHRRDESAAPQPHDVAVKRWSWTWIATCRTCRWIGGDCGLDERGRRLATEDAERHRADPEPRRELREWRPGDKWGV